MNILQLTQQFLHFFHFKPIWNKKFIICSGSISIGTAQTNRSIEYRYNWTMECRYQTLYPGDCEFDQINASFTLVLSSKETHLKIKIAFQHAPMTRWTHLSYIQTIQVFYCKLWSKSLNILCVWWLSVYGWAYFFIRDNRCFEGQGDEPNKVPTAGQGQVGGALPQ